MTLFVLDNYDTRTDLLPTIWDTIDSHVLYVLNEDGVNFDCAMVRHLSGRYWLYADDSTGYEILHEDRVRALWLAETDPRLGYDLEGNVVPY